MQIPRQRTRKPKRFVFA